MQGVRGKPASTLSARLPSAGGYVVTILIFVFGLYILYPVALIFINSFNGATLIREPFAFTFENWRAAFAEPGIPEVIRNTFFIYFLYTAVSFPIAIGIAWLLARTRMRFSYGLEFAFWVSFMMPTIATTIGWTYLLDPNVGVINRVAGWLPFVDKGPFNIYSIPGIVWAHLMANAISQKVMLLTPAFRNMNVALEEAARVSGASNWRAMLRVTLPMMIPAMTVVFMLNVVRVFQSFELEQILGRPIGFYVYSTKIFQFVRDFEPPRYGSATALASLTLIIIAVVIPLQRWLLGRRQYTTVTGQFKPGLIDLGKWQPVAWGAVAALAALLTIVPILTLLGGSFMTRVGWFNVTPVFTLRHWTEVLGDRYFMQALRTTLTLSLATAIISPVLFSMVAYVLVRTRWRGRAILDSLFWMSASIPGMLAGLGLLWAFLRTPFLTPLFGTIYALLLVVILQGKLTSTQLIKGAFLQLGGDLEEAARVSGAGWIRTYFRIWLPLLMPTLALIGTINFVLSAQATASIILIASRDTTTLSILALEKMTHADGILLEQAGIVSLFIVGMTVVVAFAARSFGLRIGVSHEMRANQESERRTAGAPAPTQGIRPSQG